MSCLEKEPSSTFIIVEAEVKLHGVYNFIMNRQASERNGHNKRRNTNNQ